MTASGSSAQEMMLRVGLDPTGLLQGSEVAGVALNKLGQQATGFGRNVSNIGRNMMSLEVGMMQVAGASSALRAPMMAAAQGVQVLGAAFSGMMSTTTLLLAGIPLLIGGMIALYGHMHKLSTATKEMVKDAQDLIKALDGVAVAQKTVDGVMSSGSMQMIKLRTQIASLDAEINQTWAKFGGDWTRAGRATVANIPAMMATTTARANREALAKELGALERAWRAAGGRIAEEFAAGTETAMDQLRLWEQIGPPAWAWRDAQSGISKARIPLPAPDISIKEMEAAGDMAGVAIKDGIERTLKNINVQYVGSGIASTISRSFMTAFSAGQRGFSDMLKSWASMLLESAVFSLIMQLLNPGKSFMGFFKSQLGFQHGTSYVPETGMFLLHKGEAVVPAAQNVFNNSINRTVNQGGSSSTFNITVQGITDPLAFAEKLEALTRRRLTRFVLEG